jgi:hypothetical protein
MGIAYSPTQQLSKTARMPIKLIRCWRNAEEDVEGMLQIQMEFATGSVWRAG